MLHYSNFFCTTGRFQHRHSNVNNKYKLTCFNFKLFECNDRPSMLSTSGVCFGEGIRNLALCRGFCEANCVVGLGKEERQRGLGEEHRERGFEGEQRARGLGEEETELCFGEDE